MKSLGESLKTFDLSEIQRRAQLCQTTNSTKSNDASKPTCEKCNDSGTIATIQRVQRDDYPIPIDVTVPIMCECYKKKIFDKYNARAGMKPNEQTRTFETAEIDNYNKPAFVQCRKFVEYIEDHLKSGSWLYIYGDEERAKLQGLHAYGTGKSYLTHCIGNYLTEKKQKAIYVTEDKLYQDIKATYNRDSAETESEVMWRYENVPILLIDDMFKSKVTDWVEDKAFHLLNNRQQPGKVTIINSNYAPNRINLVLPKNGPAIASRIIGQAILVEMVGKDRRRGIAKKRMMDAI